ncbi:signal peptidase II [Peptococcus niger]|uniref:Lipoprotein signal peptidase n=1 Tax=Peptococcus niger TaxID=2741 RepID=A0A1G6RZX6_PEPNI|nr:signal peptidase II [Peptococcus niger]SDD10220.1 signal peptidase II [Peptococcus niger]
MQTKFLGIIVLMLGLDQVSKWLVRDAMDLGQSIPITSSLMSLTYIENRGAAFGIMAGGRVLFIALTFLLLAFLLWYRHQNKHQSLLLEISTGLIIAGALGNLIDRIVKGSVTDFIDFHFFPIFNVADIAVTCGVFLMAVFIFKDENKSTNK